MRAMTHYPTAMALALAAAAGKDLKTQEKVDHQRWVARRVESNVFERKIGIKAEPATNAHLSKRTADKLIQAGIL